MLATSKGTPAKKQAMLTYQVKLDLLAEPQGRRRVPGPKALCVLRAWSEKVDGKSYGRTFNKTETEARVLFRSMPETRVVIRFPEFGILEGFHDERGSNKDTVGNVIGMARQRRTG